MASLLRALAPLKEEKKEIRVDSLTPTQIADAYMNSKINSVRMALLRGYSVPEEEEELIQSLRRAKRAEAHAIFIRYYSRADYLALNALNSTYNLLGGPNIVGTQPSKLSFLFYSSEGPHDEDLVYDEGGEMILIGLTPVQQGALTRIQADASESNVKVVTRTAEDMSTWALDNPYAPIKVVVHKQGEGIENVPTNRGTDAPDKLDLILTNERIAKIYGVDVGDVWIETRLSIDPSAIARRSVIVRYAVDPL
jgi:hypothetical protein